MDIPLPYVVAIITTLSTTVAVLWRVNQSDLKKRIAALERALAEKDKQIEKLWEKVNLLTGDASAVLGCTVKNCPVRTVAEERMGRVTLPIPLRPAARLGLLLFSLLSCISCTINPIVYTDAKGRDAAWLGGSVGTKADYETASITRPDGTVITHSRHGKDEVAIPRAYMQARLGEALGRVAGSVTKNAANNATRQALSKDAVESTRITAPLDAQTEQARIAAESATN